MLRLLGAGLSPEELACVRQALPQLGSAAELHTADTMREALRVIRSQPIGCVLMGRALIAIPAQPQRSTAEDHPPEVAAWLATAAELRRTTSQVALVAFCDQLVGELLRAACLEAFDDVVGPDELQIPMLARVLRSARAIARASERLSRWALRDPLTDVLNRRGLEHLLIRETAAQERGQGPLIALLIDCDDFKRVNDRHGLATGDHVLRTLAQTLVEAVRSGDTVARVGGDEFLVLLPQTRTWEAVEIAERVRARVPARVRLPDGETISVSIGVKRLEGRVTTVSEVLAAAEAGLTLSKATGKDRVAVADPLDVEGSGYVSLPPGGRLDAIQTREAVLLETGKAARWVLQIEGTPEHRIELAAERAAHVGWDLHWFQLALAEAPPDGLPIHVRLFPSTLLEVPPHTILARLPEEVPPRLLVIALDELFLSGDPGRLISPLSTLRREGVRLCLDASEFSRTIVESMVLLRPQVVRLAVPLIQGVGEGRVQREALGRFVGVSHALGIDVMATWGPQVVSTDRTVCKELGVCCWLGP